MKKLSDTERKNLSAVGNHDVEKKAEYNLYCVVFEVSCFVGIFDILLENSLSAAYVNST